MSDLPYPFVTELVFRAKHLNIEALSVSPIFRLWRIETLDTDIVMTQLRSALDDRSLSSAEKLKLGFLIAYSWPLHYHHRTEELLLLAKSHISESHVAESMLLWGKLSSFYLRSNQLSRALDEVTLALRWAKHRTKKDDIVPMIYWANLIFIRLKRPREIACFSKAVLVLTDAEDDSPFRQGSEYTLAISQMIVGNHGKSQSLLENACKKIYTGKSRMDGWNQTGAVQWFAQLAYEKNDIQRAENLNALSVELNQNDKHAILIARNRLLQYKLALANNTLNSANTLAEELVHYQDTTSNDLDADLNDEITQIRVAKQPKKLLPPQCSASFSASEPDILRLQQSFQGCMQSFLRPSA